jgi:hypothetical protein
MDLTGTDELRPLSVNVYELSSGDAFERNLGV